jgi:hypothetical protein
VDAIVKRYWHAYGGWSALFKSKYFWTGIFLTLAMYPTWTGQSKEWLGDILSIMPNMLGFSLGGYAMWLAIGDEDFRSLISGSSSDSEVSPYMKVNASFVHFIILQIIAIIGALLVKAHFIPIDVALFDSSDVLQIRAYLLLTWYGATYFIFVYAMLSAMAATFSLLRVSSWYDMAQSDKNNKTKK